VAASVVLDASAVLALLNDEPGADEVAAALPDAVLSSVNLSEAAAILADIGMKADDARAVLSGLGVMTVPFDDELAFLAANLRRGTRSAGLSFGDRACLALAQQRRIAALTADRAWTRLKLGVEIRLIR
jgi:ribonuclease VapC